MKLLITFAMMIPLFFPFLIKATGRNDRPDGPATSYEFSYSGTAMYPIEYYQVFRDETGALRIAYLIDQAREVSIIPAPEDIFERIDRAVSEYKLHKLRSTYTPRALVLDGYGWHVRIRFRENSIYSGGSNAWPPDRIYAGVTGINSYIRSVIDATPEEDILSRQDYVEYIRNQ